MSGLRIFFTALGLINMELSEQTLQTEHLEKSKLENEIIYLPSVQPHLCPIFFSSQEKQCQYFFANKECPTTPRHFPRKGHSVIPII